MLDVASSPGCMLSSRSDAVDGVTLNRRIVAEAFKPRNFWLASKPCHLPLCVVSVGLLRRLQRLLSRQLATQQLSGLLITEGS